MFGIVYSGFGFGDIANGPSFRPGPFEGPRFSSFLKNFDYV